MTSRVCSNHKEKKAKRKNGVKKNRPNREKKNRTKKQEAASPGVEPGLSARARSSLTTVPQ